MELLLLFSFLAGMVTILAPCIWPLLPIVLSASAGGGKRRPLGITLGVMTSFTLFTLAISYLEKFLHVNANSFRFVAVVIIGLLGLSMIIPSVGARFESFINRVLSPLQNHSKNQGTGFMGGFATGFSIGLLWAPCAGPILATIATLAATQAVNAQVVMVTLAYVLGLGIPLFIFSLAGSLWFAKMRRFNKFTGVVQQAFGFIMIAAAVLIYTNYDKTIQVKILNAFPSYGNFFSKIENNEEVGKQLAALRGEKEQKEIVLAQNENLPDLGAAAEFAGISQWLNTASPLTMVELKGKVVLVDFWTYSCINCVRTLPHVTGWYEKYKDKNFVVIGVHTPEFAFEKETANVRKALEQFKIHYPVAQDNNYQTWRAYNNHYWPAEYLIDANGHIRRTHFGEGKYDEMELAIRQLLQEAGNTLMAEGSFAEDLTPRYSRTPETYLGAKRMERFGSPEQIIGGQQVFSLPDSLGKDRFAYQGHWDVLKEFSLAQKNSALEINFTADKVFLVVGPGTAGHQLKLLLDGNIVDESNSGADVVSGFVMLDEERLYHLIDLKGKIGTHILRIEFPDGGDRVYAFTFG